MPAVVVSFIVMPAVIFAMTTLAFPLTASDAGIVTFAIVFTVRCSRSRSPRVTLASDGYRRLCHDGVHVRRDRPGHRGPHDSGLGAVANVGSTVANALMDGPVRHTAVAPAHPHAGRTPAAGFTGAAGEQR